MEHVKRLVLMPEHMVENTTQSKPLVPPLTSQVNHLDSEMDSLLKRQDITQDEKARLYSQILQRYLNYYDKRMSQPVRVSVVPSKPATTKKRYSDTTIQRYTEPEPEAGAGATRKLFKLINYSISYCFQSPQETLVIAFSGGGGKYLKILIIK